MKKMIRPFMVLVVIVLFTCFLALAIKTDAKATNNSSTISDVEETYYHPTVSFKIETGYKTNRMFNTKAVGHYEYDFGFIQGQKEISNETKLQFGKTISQFLDKAFNQAKLCKPLLATSY